MRYAADHKSRTRRRIVTMAARLFRRYGYEGVGIDRIMAAADLTRGGFYGYFRSKADLFAAVWRGEHDLTGRLEARAGGSDDDLRRQAIEVIDGYLDPANRQRVGLGCAMASLSGDVARAGRDARRAYGERVRELARQFARGLPAAQDPDPRALTAMVLSVGGLMVARAVDDEALAQAVLSACRRAAAEQLGVPAP